MANAIVRLVGQVVGEYGPRSDWYFPAWSKDCWRGRSGGCCWACSFRLIRHEIRLVREVRNGEHDPYPDAPASSEDSEDGSESVSIGVRDPHRNDHESTSGEEGER
jgi:hypothetical protein